MGYTVLHGSFVIRYPDLPRQGPQPDGDTVKFQPDSPALVNTLPRPSGRPADINSRGISVRLEAVDALETHFGTDHQELVGANAARDRLLADLGFTGVNFFPDAPNNVQSSDQDSVRGHVLSNGIDANGRMIGFVYPGDPAEPDGGQVFLDAPRVDASINATLLVTGLAYPTFYNTLPADLRTHLALQSRAARAAGIGLWPRSTADPDGAAAIPDLAALAQLVIFPKLFRRIVPYFAAGFTDFDGFDAWLRADPVNRDDALLLLQNPARPGNLHDIVTAAGSDIALTVWPEDFVISPDPAPPGGGTGSRPHAAGDVVILAALPDPAGTDAGHETVTLLNSTGSGIDLTGWHLVDAAGGKHALTGSLPGGSVTQILLGGGLALGNGGDTVILVDGKSTTIDTVTYTANQVRPGRTVCFGRTPGLITTTTPYPGAGSPLPTDNADCRPSIVAVRPGQVGTTALRRRKKGSTLGFYRRKVLPWVHNKALDSDDINEIRRRACSSLTGEVVEIGFGSGLNVPHYPAAVAHVHAVEPSAQSLRLARPRLASCVVPISIDGDDGQLLPFPDQSMDTALVTFTLCSVPDPVLAGRELFRVLVPGGSVAFVEHGASPDPDVIKWQRRLNGINRRLSACRLDTVAPQIFSNTGFTLEGERAYYLKGAAKWTGYIFEGVARKAA